jgi:hypothetical protein
MRPLTFAESQADNHKMHRYICERLRCSWTIEEG